MDGLDASLVDEGFNDDPFPTYARLRAEDPVHWSDAWGVWVVTRYADIQAVIRDSATFSNAGRFAALVESLPPEEMWAADIVRRHNAVGMLQSDPPDHTRLRGLIRQVFTPRVVEGLRPRVDALVARALDRVDPEGFDVIHDLAFRLPISVILELLGLPEEDTDYVARLADDVSSLQSTGRAVSANAHRAATAIVEIEAYFDRVCRARRTALGDDLISRMVSARLDDERLSDDEMINMCVNLLFAGHQTTEHLIGNAALLLLDHPDARQALMSDPSLWDTAIEECLRFQSPIQRAWRRVAAPTSLHGRDLAAGQLVYLMLGSANRDPDVFPEPETFDIRRKPNRHLAFGYGIHFCIGAPLARLEGPIALRHLFTRYPELEVVEPPARVKSIHLRGVDRLAVRA